MKILPKSELEKKITTQYNTYILLHTHIIGTKTYFNRLYNFGVLLG